MDNKWKWNNTSLLLSESSIGVCNISQVKLFKTVVSEQNERKMWGKEILQRKPLLEDFEYILDLRHYVKASDDVDVIRRFHVVT